MHDDELNNIDESTISEDMDVVSPEQPINQAKQPQNLNNNINANTISNSVNSLKNGIKQGKELSSKVQNLKNKKVIPAMNNAEVSSPGNTEQKDAKMTGEEKQSVANKAATKVASKVAAKIISKKTHGIIKEKQIKEVLEKSKAVSFAKKRLKMRLAVGVAVGLVFVVILTSILMTNDDESYTSIRTNDYIMDQSTDEKLIEYMGYISICPSAKEAKEKAEKYGIELVDGEITFEIMEKIAEQDEEELTETCKNAIKFYRAFKGEFVENRKPCYRDRDENKEILPNYWRHDDPESSFSSNPKVQAYFVKGEKSRKDEYDCQLMLPTLLMFETMSYDLTDQDLFNKEYLTRPNYSEYHIDLRKLANALSEFMHETCYQWDIQYYLRGTHVENCSGPECSVVKTKVPYDGYYFQVSFDKYVCYLKYGDTCEHPNYDEEPKPREKYPDMDYMKHECGGPENDELDKLSGEEKEEEKIDAVVWLGDSLTYGYYSGCSGDDAAPWRHMGLDDSIDVSAIYHEGMPIGKHADEILSAEPNPDPDKFYVIWAGNSDYGDAASNHADEASQRQVAHYVISLIKNYISSNGLKHYLILGTQASPGKYANMINNELSKAFDGHFMDIQPYVIFVADKIHFTPESYKNIGQAVGKKVSGMINSSYSSGKTGTSTNGLLAKLFPNGIPTTEAQMAPYLIDITIPAADVNGNIRNVSLTVHKDLANTIQSIFQELANMKYPIKEVGGYDWRTMASGTGSRSHHSYGVAIDINSTDNPAVYQGGTVNKNSPYYVNSKVVEVFKKHGFYWGGDWSASYYDPMHFSYTNH